MPYHGFYSIDRSCQISLCFVQISIVHVPVVLEVLGAQEDPEDENMHENELQFSCKSQKSLSKCECTYRWSSGQNRAETTASIQTRPLQILPQNRQTNKNNTVYSKAKTTGHFTNSNASIRFTFKSFQFFRQKENM